MKRKVKKSKSENLTCSEHLLTALKLHQQDVLLLLRFRSILTKVIQILERYQDKDAKKLLDVIKKELDK